jgi:hypothetical protein
MVFTREGAADRRNGLVIAQLYDPAHPVPIAEFTDGVTAGSPLLLHLPAGGARHPRLPDEQRDRGPAHPGHLGPVQPPGGGPVAHPPPRRRRTLHDVDVQDGLAYLSYWNDGLVILDIGNGIKGGSPSNPQLVSWVKYDLNEEYRDVEARGMAPASSGAPTPRGATGSTSSWGTRSSPPRRGGGEGCLRRTRAFGNLHVFDVSDLENPKKVAWWKPDYGGVHNVWAAGDTLYMGAYNAGFRTFDISGELFGDLGAQGGRWCTSTPATWTASWPTSPMTWGVVVRGRPGLRERHAQRALDHPDEAPGGAGPGRGRPRPTRPPARPGRERT